MFTPREVFESTGTAIPLNGNLDHVNGKPIGIGRETDHVSGDEYVVVFIGNTLVARFDWRTLPVRE